MGRGEPTAPPVEQRVFSLILALVASPGGLTKSELLSTVFGYSRSYVPGGNNTTLERQFERDKEHIRELGIAIETVESPGEPGNNQLLRYRISRTELEFPADLKFDDQELLLLRLAALAWKEGSLNPQFRRATMKVAAMSGVLDDTRLGIVPDLGIVEPSAAQLQRAIAQCRTVEFHYAHPQREKPYHRRAAPLRLHRYDGRWHLIAVDIERSSPRVFLLSRIVDPVTVLPDDYDAELLELGESVVRELESYAEQQRAVIEVTAGSAADARFGPRALPSGSVPAEHESGSDRRVRYEISMVEPELLAAEVAGFGLEARVLEPSSLATRVTELLTDIVAAHVDPNSGEVSP